MKRKRPDVARFIVKHHKSISKVFLTAFAVCVLFYFFVGVNYDLSEYLPTESPSKQGIDIMEREFGYPGTARVMVEGVSVYEAKLYKDRIAAVEGVDMVLWADTMTDIYTSSTFIDYGAIEDYYKDNSACMDVIFVDGDSDKSTHRALDEIESILGDRGYMGGPAVQNKSLGETLNREMMIAISMAIVMIAAILCLTTTSWFEPVLFLTVMLIAIVLNMGTNIFQGSISFLTYSIAAVLQLAIAMDYSIFLLHTFSRERESGLEPEEAMVSALKKSSSSILASGVTTVVGFVVLTIMRFRIGYDIGIVLTKGVVISLLTVLFFMPSLILRFYPLIERLRHKNWMPTFRGLAKWVGRVRVPALVILAILVVPAYIGQTMIDFSYGSEAVSGSPGTEVYDAENAMNERFGRSNMFLLMLPNSSSVTERELYSEVTELEYVKSAISLSGLMPEGIPERILPRSLTELLHTDDYARMIVVVKSASESELAFQANSEIQQLVLAHYPEGAYVVGVTPSTADIKDVIVDDYNLVNLLSLLGVALTVLVTFKSATAPIIVMIPIEAAVFLNMCMGYICGDRMMYVGYIVVSCLQLGATIDYAILMCNNYIDARQTMNKKTAMRDAISKSALSIFTSGSILAVVGYGLYFVSSVEAIGGMGRMVGRGAIFSVACVITILPALMYYLDSFFVKCPSNPTWRQRAERIAEWGREAQQKFLRWHRKRKHKKENTGGETDETIQHDDEKETEQGSKPSVPANSGMPAGGGTPVAK